MEPLIVIILDLPYPPSVNTYWRNVGSKVLISEKGRKYRRNIQGLILEAGRVRINGRVQVAIDAYPPDRRKRDLDNILKALLDSLTHAGVIEDDECIDKITITRREVIKGGKVTIAISNMIKEPS